ncbi:MAG: group 1 truncated hemoglobin, partial [Deltaproteobacteria bacterium]
MIRTLGFLACLLLVACGSGSSHKTPAKPTPAEPAEPVASDPAPPEPSPEAPAAAPAASRTLYQRLGETPAITLVVEEFVGRTTTDPRIKERFFNTDAVNLKRLLVEFVCQATGGPCKYTGRDMVSSHAGMDLVDEEFNALVDNLSGALDKYKVPDREKNELLGALGPLKPQIVASPDKLHPIDDAQLARAEKVAAKRRGQRSYAEQLFSRAEMMTGPKPLNPIANVFRAGAPQRVASPLKKLPSDTPAQPRTAGGSETDEPDRRPAAGSLHGSIRIDGKTPSGLGVVMLWPERGGKKRVAKQRIIEQRGKMFAPHVMAVPVGSTVS